MTNDEVPRLAKILWDYHRLDHPLKPCGAILALGSHDLRVAERAAELHLWGMAPWLIFSGGLGNLTLGVWDRPEAELFAEIAFAMGVPRDRVLIENRSTNTGENIEFTKRLLDERSLHFNSFLLVQKPYMERRAYATFRKRWPEKEVLVTSPSIDFEDYPNEEIPFERVVHIMVGDLQRIRLYPDLGFQVPQEIPPEVERAFQRLVELGFDQHLIKPTDSTSV